MEENKTIIEVNGIKLEVDLRTAKRIDTLRVGDRVKVLVKSYDDYKVHAGVVVGFEPFAVLPTIIVAYMELSYSEAKLTFLHFNARTKETEIIKAIDNDQLDVDKTKMCNLFDKQIEAKERELADLHAKKIFFLTEFRRYWEFEPVTVGSA